MASGDSRVSGVSGRELLEDSIARERGGRGEGGCKTLWDEGSRGSGGGKRSWGKRGGPRQLFMPLPKRWTAAHSHPSRYLPDGGQNPAHCPFFRTTLYPVAVTNVTLSPPSAGYRQCSASLSACHSSARCDHGIQAVVGETFCTMARVYRDHPQARMLSLPPGLCVTGGPGGQELTTLILLPATSVTFNFCSTVRGQIMRSHWPASSCTPGHCALCAVRAVISWSVVHVSGVFTWSGIDLL